MGLIQFIPNLVIWHRLILNLIFQENVVNHYGKLISIYYFLGNAVLFFFLPTTEAFKQLY